MSEARAGHSSPYLAALRAPGDTLTVELRPPLLGRTGPETMDDWIDLHHGVRRLARKGHFLFLTDNAVGTAEEENLAHLGANLSEEVDPGRVAPFLTSKHTLDYCLRYAERAWARGFRALAVLGGDQQVGPPRCLPHAYLLRRKIRERLPEMALGGWANPHRDPRTQAGYLAADAFSGEFWLSQVVSHHSLDRVEGFLRALEEAGLEARGPAENPARGKAADDARGGSDGVAGGRFGGGAGGRSSGGTDPGGRPLPGVFGVFYYRSGNPRTLRRLGGFFPVPAQELGREFASGASPEEVCARTIRGLGGLGIRNLYLSNLPIRGAEATLSRILELV